MASAIKTGIRGEGHHSDADDESAFAINPQGEDDEDSMHLGVIEYEISCLPCHGIDGRGDGLDAEHLATWPVDLTGIAKVTGGAFPAEGLALIIDGLAIVAAHGPRTMPVWGERYRAPVSDEDGDIDMEREARSRIDALVRYIESLQEP